MQIHHAGIATDDADSLAELYTTLFETQVVHEETLDGMKVVFLEFDNGYFELLEPADSGPIASYLNTHGPGIHHLAVATEDIESALSQAESAGVELIDDNPRAGAWGHEVAFLHPSSTGGVLIEFVNED